MSPLWSDMALAQAAWANAVERGIVDDTKLAKAEQREGQRAARRPSIRRIPRRILGSVAL